MANEWDTRQKALDELEQAYIEGSTAKSSSVGYMATAGMLISASPQSYVKDIFVEIASAINLTNHAIHVMLARDGSGTPIHLIPYFLTHYTIDGAVEAEELTWETIVTAWANASKTGRLYTVLTIDEMRKTVWQEEFTSFTLQAPGEE